MFRLHSSILCKKNHSTKSAKESRKSGAEHSKAVFLLYRYEKENDWRSKLCTIHVFGCEPVPAAILFLFCCHLSKKRTIEGFGINIIELTFNQLVSSVPANWCLFNDVKFFHTAIGVVLRACVLFVQNEWVFFLPIYFDYSC